jgi:hypothetical protein
MVSRAIWTLKLVSFSKNFKLHFLLLTLYFIFAEIDKCNPNPCQHAGSCSEIIGGLGYACKCPYGYQGQDCERKIFVDNCW